MSSNPERRPIHNRSNSQHHTPNNMSPRPTVHHHRSAQRYPKHTHSIPTSQHFPPSNLATNFIAITGRLDIQSKLFRSHTSRLYKTRSDWPCRFVSPALASLLLERCMHLRFEDIEKHPLTAIHFLGLKSSRSSQARDLFNATHHVEDSRL